jgi:hypothetical protein
MRCSIYDCRVPADGVEARVRRWPFLVAALAVLLAGALVAAVVNGALGLKAAPAAAAESVAAALAERGLPKRRGDGLSLDAADVAGAANGRYAVADRFRSGRPC